MASLNFYERLFHLSLCFSWLNHTDGVHLLHSDKLYWKAMLVVLWDFLSWECYEICEICDVKNISVKNPFILKEKTNKYIRLIWVQQKKIVMIQYEKFNELGTPRLFEGASVRPLSNQFLWFICPLELPNMFCIKCAFNCFFESESYSLMLNQ